MIGVWWVIFCFFLSFHSIYDAENVFCFFSLEIHWKIIFTWDPCGIMLCCWHNALWLLTPKQKYKEKKKHYGLYVWAWLKTFNECCFSALVIQAFQSLPLLHALLKRNAVRDYEPCKCYEPSVMFSRPRWMLCYGPLDDASCSSITSCPVCSQTLVP